jgi:hypothetical protein
MPKTSVYLPGDLSAAVKASGVPLAELVRRGLGVEGADVQTARQAAAEALDAVRDELAGMVERAVRSALHDAQGGSW